MILCPSSGGIGIRLKIEREQFTIANTTRKKCNGEAVLGLSR